MELVNKAPDLLGWLYDRTDIPWKSSRILNPIPGQEERNSDHLLEAGAALRCHSLSTLAWKVESLLADPARLQRLRDAARAAAHPRAAFDIVDTMVALLRTVPAHGLPPLGTPMRGHVQSSGSGGKRRR